MKQRHRVLIDVLVVIALAAALALIAAGWQGALAAQGIIYVDAGAAGANSGTSWDDAFPTLQQALDVAGAGDQIWVAAGTYKPAVEYEGTGNRFKSFQMKNGVAIYGGFDPGAGDVAWGHRDWVNNRTILSGDRGTAEDGLDDSYHVFYHPAGTVGGSARLDGFIITGGSAKAEGDASPHQNGGGMYNDRSSPTLKNVTFTGNSAVDGGGMYNGPGSSPALSKVAFEDNEADLGGGMYNGAGSSPVLNNVTFAGNSAAEGGGMFNHTGSEPLLTNCAFEGNEAGSNGGGMYNLESSPVLSSVTFRNNLAYHGGGMHNQSSAPALSSVTFTGNSANSCGGGMCNEFSSPTLIDCTFEGNEAGSDGGGMYNMVSSPTLINCTFSGNSAAGGGGMANYFSSPALTGCTFLDNSVGDRGGGIHNEGSSPTLTNCTFMGNSAGNWGGGMANRRASSPTLTNCTLTGNSAGHGGGGMFLKGSMSILTNCTFSGNEAPLGGGVFIDYDIRLSRLVMTNCILWGDADPEIENHGFTLMQVSYSDVQGGWDGEGNIDLDPRFVDPDSGDFHLAQDSPCIDAGSNDPPYGLPEYDFEGDHRVLDGDGDGSAIVDMGVDEFAADSVLNE
jgi:parallel beta-helix repeat protein